MQYVGVPQDQLPLKIWGQMTHLRSDCVGAKAFLQMATVFEPPIWDLIEESIFRTVWLKHNNQQLL